jgi:uncharacterized protein (TIGR00251 family)
VTSPISPHADGVVVDVYVQPRSSRSEIVGVHDGALRIRITAPPVEGAANATIVDLLSRATGVRKSDIEIVSGQSSRRKRVLIRGANAHEVSARLDISPA